MEERMEFIELNGVRITVPCDKLMEALSKMQGTLDNAKKESQNPYYKSKYADLATCIATSKKPMADNGLSLSQHCSFDGASVHCVSVLGHTSGQMMVSTLNVTVTKKDAQGIGAAITYARRYALSSIIGLAQEDDDGNSAVGEPPNENESGEAKETEPTHPFSYATQKQVELIKNITTRNHIEVDSILKRYSVANLESLSKEQASNCIGILNNQVKSNRG